MEKNNDVSVFDLAIQEWKRISESGRLDQYLNNSDWFKRVFIEEYRALAGCEKEDYSEPVTEYKFGVSVYFSDKGHLIMESNWDDVSEIGKIEIGDWENHLNSFDGKFVGQSRVDRVQFEVHRINYILNGVEKKEEYYCVSRRSANNYFLPTVNNNYIVNCLSKVAYHNGIEVGRLYYNGMKCTMSSKLERSSIEVDPIDSNFIPIHNGDLPVDILPDSLYYLRVDGRQYGDIDGIVISRIVEKDKIGSPGLKTTTNYHKNGSQYPNLLNNYSFIGTQYSNPLENEYSTTFDNRKYSSLEEAIAVARTEYNSRLGQKTGVQKK